MALARLKLLPKLAPLFAGALLFVSCGTKEKDSSGESLPSTIPNGILAPPPVSKVPIGSRDVVSFPPAGPATGVVFLQLSGEPESDIRYSYRDPSLDGETPLAKGQKYNGALVVWPPATVWVVATVKGESGPVRRFDFPWVGQDGTSLETFSAKRFPNFGQAPELNQFVSITASTADETFDSSDAPPTGLLHKQLDGRVDDWSLVGRTFGRDARGDMPQQSADIVYGIVDEDEKYFHFLISTADRPRTDNEVVYGVEIGPSNVNFSNFGGGAEVTYNVFLDSGRLVIESKGVRQPVSTVSSAFVGDAVELRVIRQDLPLLADVTELIARPYAMVLTGGVKTSDRMRPLYLRSKFSVSRISAPLNGNRVTDVSVFTDPQYKSAPVVGTYLTQIRSFLPSIELLHQMPLFETGSIPFFYSEKEANGYTGLNSFDRGLLTTLGPKNSAIEHAQLIAHEIAHFHNALTNRINLRWFQEGMSEWSAERILYRHFPRRAVQQYIRKLRIDHYWNTVGATGIDAMPLNNWEGSVSDLGYSKSLMFLDLLEARVGAEPLRKLQQYGINQNLDSDGIQKFLEQESGKNLDAVFRFWVFPGDPSPENDPRTLFKDEDLDGLLGLEEEILGTSPFDIDSDKDGFTDDEEFSAGTNPAVSSIDSSAIAEGSRKTIHILSGQLSNPPTAIDPVAMLRIGGEEGSEFSYSFDPKNSATSLDSDLWASEYSGPVFLHPPYKVLAQALVGGIGGTVNTIEHALFVNGTSVSTPFLSELILPQAPKITTTLPSPTFGGLINLSLSDSTMDMPRELSAYNIVGFSISQTAQTLTAEFTTQTPPDPHGSNGSFFLSFKTIDPNEASPPPVRTRFTFSTDAGVAYKHTFVSLGGETVVRIPVEQYTTFGNTMKFNIPLSDLSTWEAEAGTKLICGFTTSKASSTMLKISDNPGCLVYEAPTYTPISATGTGYFGTGPMTVQVLVPTTGYNQAAAQEYAQLAIAAIQGFEKALARPLLDRSLWTSTIKFLTGNSALGTADLTSGAFLAFNPGTAPAASRRYLFIEQLARLVLADMLDRQKTTPPYWVQEFFVQWLTAASMYSIFPSREAHSHTAARFEQYRCYTANEGCAYLFPEIPLDAWVASVSGTSTGAVKSMMFALELDATLGSAVMSEVFHSFAHKIPSSAELRTKLLNIAPAKAAVINAMFNLWVVGSGNIVADAASIRSTFSDTETPFKDGLLLFEETALGLNPNVYNNYLD